jgi:hypothetical protein
MAIQNINIGSSSNDGTGDTLRVAGAKINGNFSQISSTIAANTYGGVLTHDTWTKLPSIYKLMMNGTGSVRIDTRAFDGYITTNVVTYTVSGASEVFAYFENAYEIRAIITGSATVEVL